MVISSFPLALLLTLFETTNESILLVPKQPLLLIVLKGLVAA
jgi:hypothetical protein